MKKINLLISLVCLSLISFFVCVALSNAEVIGYWDFDDKNGLGNDSSGKANHGEPQVNAQWTENGKFGSGLKLDGESWIEVPHNNNLNVKNQITLMCWVIFDEVGNFYQTLIWKNAPFQKDPKFWASYSLRLWRSGLNQGGFGFDANTTKDRTITLPGDPDYPKAKEWYHVAAVADGKEVKIYTNGKEKAKATQNGDFKSSTEPLTIGFDLRNPATIKEYVRGIIDEAAVFSHALTQAEIQQAMSSGVQTVLSVRTAGKLSTTWSSIKGGKKCLF